MNVVSEAIEFEIGPRRQPTTIPIPIPTAKLMTVATPTRQIVHGSRSAMIVETRSGKNVTDRPNFSCATLTR
jgi:hypothetical protein